MEIWLDTTDESIITDAAERGILHGVTTNPTIVSQSGLSLEDLLERLLDIQDGPVAAQVVADTPEEIIRQAEMLTAHSPRVIVKVPVCEHGLKTIYRLTQSRIPVMATAVFNAEKALLALKAGAHYIAPYIGRMEDSGADASASLQLMQKICDNYAFEGKIIAAGIRSRHFVLFCAEHGIPAITINETIYSELIAEDKRTAEAVNQFHKDWQTAEQSEIIPK